MASSSSISINGQNLNAAFDIGPSVDAMASQAYSFLNQNNAQNQAFLGATITGSQNFLANQLTPLSSAIAATQTANAAMIPTAINDFQNLMLAQTGAMTNAVNTGYSTIYQNTVNTNNASQSVANSGGDSFVCTAMYDEGILSPDDYETLNEFKDVYMMSSHAMKRELMLYYRKAPKLVESIKHSPISKDIFIELKEQFLDRVLIYIKDCHLDLAYRTYRNMMLVIVSMFEQVEA